MCVPPPAVLRWRGLGGFGTWSPPPQYAQNAYLLAQLSASLRNKFQQTSFPLWKGINLGNNYASLYIFPPNICDSYRIFYRVYDNNYR